MDALRTWEPWATQVWGYAFAMALGALWGSFANVCIYRLPQGLSVVSPGSRCGECKAPVRWYDNVPILAYLWLRGRCRACGVRFSPRYALVEALTAVLFGVAWWAAVEAQALFEPFELRLLRFAIYGAFVLLMVVITFIDLDHQLILDKVSLPAILVFYVAGLALGHDYRDGLWGAAFGYGLVWSIDALYRLLRGQDGMGLGDAKLLAVVGAFLGWRGVVASLFGGALVGSVVSLVTLALLRRLPETMTHPAPAPVVDEVPDQVPDQARDGMKPSTAAPAPGQSPSPPSEPEQAPEDAPASALETPIPFGPFLAVAAVFYVFAEPWLQISVAFLGGR